MANIDETENLYKVIGRNIELAEGNMELRAI